MPPRENGQADGAVFDDNGGVFHGLTGGSGLRIVWEMKFPVHVITWSTSLAFAIFAAVGWKPPAFLANAPWWVWGLAFVGALCAVPAGFFWLCLMSKESQREGYGMWMEAWILVGVAGALIMGLHHGN